MLLYSLDGVLNIPRGKAGAFSKANWGDYSMQAPCGSSTLAPTIKVVKRASVFLKEIGNLKEQQWNDIILAAWEANEVSKRRSGVGLGEAGVINEASSDDAELLDPLYA